MVTHSTAAPMLSHEEATLTPSRAFSVTSGAWTDLWSTEGFPIDLNPTKNADCKNLLQQISVDFIFYFP
jgi:hypothetical protein